MKNTLPDGGTVHPQLESAASGESSYVKATGGLTVRQAYKIAAMPASLEEHLRISDARNTAPFSTIHHLMQTALCAGRVADAMIAEDEEFRKLKLMAEAVAPVASPVVIPQPGAGTRAP